MANLHVNQKVASSGAGTSLALAKKTIAEAITAAAINDTIYIYEGVYNETISLPNFRVNIVGIGYVELNGGATLNYGITLSAGFGYLSTNNLKFKNYVLADIDVPNYCFVLKRCEFSKTARYPSQVSAEDFLNGNIINGSVQFAFGGGSVGYPTKENFFKSGNIDFSCSIDVAPRGFLRNIFNSDVTFHLLPVNPIFAYNNFTPNSRVRFDRTKAYVHCSSVADLEAKFLADRGVPINSGVFSTNTFYDPIFNNETKNNYTLEYDEINNPITFAKFTGNAIGAFEAATNGVCKSIAAGGNVELYDISADVYGIGIFTGITNVGVIDDANEKLTRSATGANNWGVFLITHLFPRAHVVKNTRMYGQLLDRNGGIVSVNPADFANMQVDWLEKWSAVLDDTQLKNSTSEQFIRTRLRSNEYANLFIDNAGVLVGDGDPDYPTLVNSSDGGSGSLVPQKKLAKSIVQILILQDVV